MTVKELKKEYFVIYDKGMHHLHSLTESGRGNYKYLVSVDGKGGYFFVNGHKPTAKIKELKEQIDYHLNNLKHDSEYYCPLYRKGFGQECLILDTLEKYGFGRADYSDVFKYVRNGVYGTPVINSSFTFSVKDEEIVFCLWQSDGSWIQTKSTYDFDDIVNSIDGMLKPLFLFEGVNNIKNSDQMKNSKLDLVRNKLIGFAADKENVNKELKEKLLELANTL